MNVIDETATLKKAAVFGPPGIEAYLAQFYQPEESLFFEDFDVREAGAEFKKFIDLLAALGVEVINLREWYAQTLPNPINKAESLVAKLMQKVPQADQHIVEGLLHDTALEITEEKAVAVAEHLSLFPDIPLGNIYFARDLGTVIGGEIFMGNMKHKIRQPEVAAVYKALKNYVESKGQHGPSFTPFPATLVPGTFEGGDALLHDGGLFVGVGSRTSEHGAQSIALSKHSGKNSYLVRIPPASGWRQDMYVMHLDTFFMPLTQKTVLGCEVVLDACVLEEVHGGGKQNFLGYLEQRYDIIDVPQKEQNNFAANVLGVGSGKIVVPSEQNPLTNKLLKANNFNTYNAGFKELTKGFGASHCMVLALERDNGPASEYFPGNG